METLKRKLTSRKLWVAIAAFVTLVMVHSGADQGSAESVAAIIMAAATVISYILGEGFIDAEAVKYENEEDNEDE